MSEDRPDLASLEHTQRSVRAVEQVVRALESIARSQRGAVEAVAAEASIYLDWIDEVIDALAGPPAEIGADAGLSVVLGPERGLCGPLPNAIAAQIPRTGALAIVGTRLADVLDEDESVTARIRFRLPGPTAVEELPEIAGRLARAVLHERPAGQVLLWHPRDAQSDLASVRLLSGARRIAQRLPVETWSDPALVLEAAVSESVAGRVTVALAESLRSEVQASLLAAGAARQACEGRQEELHREIATVRQEQTTRELLEIVASHLTGT